MSEETKVVMKKRNKTIVIGAVALIAIILVTVLATVVSKSASAKKSEEHLSLGEKYLSELDYEQAIASYLAVIEIDSKNVDAYLGLADAYIAQGEYDEAIEVLEDALDKLSGTARRAVKDKLREIKELKELSTGEKVNPVLTVVPTAAVSRPKPQKPELIMTPYGAMCTYDFKDLSYYMSYNMTYDISDNGTMNAQFYALWSEAMFLFPKVIDMNYCNKLVVRVKSETGPVMIKFYGEERFLETVHTEIFSVDSYGNGIIEYEVSFSAGQEVAGIGVMSTSDYSFVDASVYDVTFYMDEDYAEKLLTEDIAYTFDFDDMEYYASDGVEYNKKEDASIDVQFDYQHAEVQFRLPELIDMEYCNRIVINLECDVSPVTVKFYGEDNFENNSELFACWECRNAHLRKKVLIPAHFNYINDNVGGIGIMNIKNYADLEATVYSITFYMDAEYPGNVPAAKPTTAPKATTTPTPRPTNTPTPTPAPREPEAYEIWEQKFEAGEFPADRAWIDDLYNMLMEGDYLGVVDVLKDDSIAEKVKPYLYHECLGEWSTYKLVTSDSKFVGINIPDDITNPYERVAWCSPGRRFNWDHTAYGDIAVLYDPYIAEYYDYEYAWFDGTTAYYSDGRVDYYEENQCFTVFEF